MQLIKTVVIGALVLGAGTGAATAQGTAPPCNSDAHRAFDFWVGEWNVHGPQGKVAGTNSITREYDGCVIHEHYVTGRGYSGESLNAYDPTRGVWHQTWVDSSGALLLLEGGMRGTSMVLEGKAPGADGKIALQRISWTPAADGSVRQLWEAQGADGKWSVVFDGKYTRK